MLGVLFLSCNHSMENYNTSQPMPPCTVPSLPWSNKRSSDTVPYGSTPPAHWCPFFTKKSARTRALRRHPIANLLTMQINPTASLRASLRSYAVYTHEHPLRRAAVIMPLKRDPADAYLLRVDNLFWRLLLHRSNYKNEPLCNRIELWSFDQLGLSRARMQMNEERHQRELKRLRTSATPSPI